MPCETLENEKGEPVGFICTAPWGLGGKTYRWTENGEAFEEYGYGMGGPPMDPHDFSPDGVDDGSTPDEIEAWEKAKAECKCGRE